MSTMEPLGDRVLIRPDEAPDVSPGGVIIPDVAQEKPQLGVVVGVGPGKLLDDGSHRPLEIAEGETVLYSRYGGNEVEIEGESLVMIDCANVLARETPQTRDQEVPA